MHGTRGANVAQGGHVAEPREPTWMPTWAPTWTHEHLGWQMLGPRVSGHRLEYWGILGPCGRHKG